MVTIKTRGLTEFLFLESRTTFFYELIFFSLELVELLFDEE